MYVNDLPPASEFSTTLFADDTYLVLTDNNLLRLEHKIHFQLQLVDKWLRKNKLTLNLSKTTYLLFNKQPHVPISSKFNLFINQKKISKSDSVKYLGVWIDDRLNWSAHIHAFSLQLARQCSMLYHIRDFVPQYTLIMLYYSFVYSYVNYGITTWGTADQSKEHEIKVKMNNIVRTITWNKKFTHVSHLYQNLNLLKLNDICKLELAKFMHKLYNNNLPIVFQNRFAKIEKIFTYVTRGANKSNYFLSRVNKTVGQNKLEYRGVKLWNQISEKLKCKSFNLFKKLYKSFC